VYYLEYDWVEKRINDIEDKKKYIKIFESKVDYVCKVLKHNFTNEKMCMLIEGDSGNLTNVMRGINGSFAKYYNRRHLRQGRVFKQRFKNILIESKEKHQYYSNYISEISNTTQNEEKLYNHILFYAMKKLIPIDRLIFPNNANDKIMRQDLIQELINAKIYSISDITQTLKISKSTIFRIIKCIKL
jgi:hypothetical protein